MAPLPSPSIAAEPVALRAAAWPDYALIDSGGGRKLERYGPYTVVRPEAQCLWAPGLEGAAWDAADAVFEGGDEEEAGRWRFARPLPETFPMAWRGVRFHGRFTAFRHLGVFPEQAANWEWLDVRLATSATRLNVLNLFGYTGVASLVAAARGASVTHVDASKKAVGWARENAALAELSSAPVRWICEDARKYVQREVRRGSRYDGIILDPPKYGRGPAGEVWRLHEDLPALIAGCAALLSEEASFLLLNAYSERLSGLALASLLADALRGRDGVIDWGELALREESRERGAGLSFFARWSATSA
ncbi:MAG: class I SAM-dependent methyltransferase [Pseudomonadota bacterium]|nr:class I SAM-dependent methyltransferase [Pseudomonadota bacterium]